ncbi:GatB/YqeY domain-containing protein [Thiohalomonas denitrificans]|uniref:GatB/YqeY domain-containing protein n=1 Tax=Thiohalomonas denitrificans TaxID=415747 RepID=UPI0026F0FCD2|nr:GatB/YqeY domain-containing protein [Thiohalomonas denitrificans]
MAENLKQRLQDEMKAAMRSKDKERLTTVRLILAAIKQREIDERIELDDADVLAVLDKMVKQRHDSITQYRDAGREELAAKEEAELSVIQEFMPAPLSEAELDGLIDQAVADSAAVSMKDMGKVMGALKPKVQGRADMGALSAKVKAKLS